MAYFKPYISSSGLHLPTFQDILDDMIDKAKGIFGTDIYLGNDSADYQLLAIFARKVHDTLMSVQQSYNDRSPITAIGTGLDSIVKLNGLRRKTPGFSTCDLVITGTPGTIIQNGVAQDLNGYRWDLPETVTIPLGGTIIVSAVCETVGAIMALAGDIRTIATPTAGWISVSNPSSAVPGSEVEMDSALRARQALSTATPSQTELAGTMAALAALPGVTRFRIFENPTGSPDTDPNGLGLPGHSITCVVEGASDAEVGNSIYLNRGIGCFTNGTTTVHITDPIFSVDCDISFFRPTPVPFYVDISVHSLTGAPLTSAVKDAVRGALVTYLNSLQIYETVTISGLFGAALSVMPNLAQPIFSIQGITADTVSPPVGTVDIPIDYYEVAATSPDNIVLTEV